MTRTPDTSVVVAGLSSWHVDHDVARRELARKPPALAAVLIEAYSVLTRLPTATSPASTAGARRVGGRPSWRPDCAPGRALRTLLNRLVDHNVVGGGA
jgi:hypothetical protein